MSSWVRINCLRLRYSGTLKIKNNWGTWQFWDTCFTFWVTDHHKTWLERQRVWHGHIDVQHQSTLEVKGMVVGGPSYNCTSPITLASEWKQITSLRLPHYLSSKVCLHSSESSPSGYDSMVSSQPQVVEMPSNGLKELRPTPGNCILVWICCQLNLKD